MKASLVSLKSSQKKHMKRIYSWWGCCIWNSIVTVGVHHPTKRRKNLSVTPSYSSLWWAFLSPPPPFFCLSYFFGLKVIVWQPFLFWQNTLFGGHQILSIAILRYYSRKLSYKTSMESRYGNFVTILTTGNSSVVDPIPYHEYLLLHLLLLLFFLLESSNSASSSSTTTTTNPRLHYTHTYIHSIVWHWICLCV